MPQQYVLSNGKIVALPQRRQRWAVMLLFLIGAAAGWHYFGATTSNADEDYKSPVSNPKHPTEPHLAVAALYEYVAHGYPEKACLLFTEDGKKAFANSYHAPNCEQAVRDLHAKVSTTESEMKRYSASGEPGPLASVNSPATINTCTMAIQYGPKLGKITLTKRPQQNDWSISDHRPC